MTPVPGTGARYTGVNGRPLPVVSWPVIGPAFEQRALHAVEQRAAADADAGRVLNRAVT